LNKAGFGVSDGACEAGKLPADGGWPFQKIAPSRITHE
jgi:hypothetical protein